MALPSSLWHSCLAANRPISLGCGTRQGGLWWALIFWFLFVGDWLGPVQPRASALTFNLTYDTSTNSAPSGFLTAFNGAIQFYETNLTDPITINLQVGWGEVAGQNLTPGFLGQSSANQPGFFQYSTVKSALISDGKSASDLISIANMLANYPISNATFKVSRRRARRVGMIAGDAAGIDGAVGFDSTAPFTFDPNNRAVMNKYDFIGVAEHEISEVMGRFGLGSNAAGPLYTPLDLFRYTSPGVLDTAPENGVYFSINGGGTVINTFNGTGGGDLSDWAGATIDSYNASLVAGQILPVSAGDMIAMDVIGYDVAIVWTGSNNANWSTASNWSTAPINGSSLIFDGTSRVANTNDSLTNVGSITFNSTAGAFTLTGNALSIAGGIINKSTRTQTINLNLTLSGPQQFNAASGNLGIGGVVNLGGTTLSITGSANTAIGGAISGAGAITKSGSGTAALSGNSSYTGGTTVNSGTLIVSHVHGLGQSRTNGLTINNTALVKITTGTGAGPVVLPSLSINGGTSPLATLDHHQQ